MRIYLIKAAPDDLAWVNEQYDKVRFRRSVYEREHIVIAEVDGVRAGIGRLVSIDANNLELGGMYVGEDFRGLGLARSIVLYLLGQAQEKPVYCLPFAHLESFYTSCGFRPVAAIANVPEKLAQKWKWCQKTYPQPTILLQIPV